MKNNLKLFMKNDNLLLSPLGKRWPILSFKIFNLMKMICFQRICKSKTKFRFGGKGCKLHFHTDDTVVGKLQLLP